MLQHLLLVLIVPPLALLGLPRAHGARRPRPRAHAVAPGHVGPGVGAMWLWHAPTLCNAAAQSGAVHRMQEPTLVAHGARVLVAGLSPRPRTAHRAAGRRSSTSSPPASRAPSWASWSRSRPSRCARYTCARSTAWASCPLCAGAGGSRRRRTSRSAACSCGCRRASCTSSAILAMLGRFYRDGTRRRTRARGRRSRRDAYEGWNVTEARARRRGPRRGRRGSRSASRSSRGASSARW